MRNYRVLKAVGLVGMALWPTLVGVQRAQAQVEIPPGWEIVTIIENEEGRFCNWPDINDRGDLVFDCMDWPDQSTREIFLYTRGQLIQLTDDDLRDGFPKINNKQEIVWWKDVEGGGNTDIVLWRDGELEVISSEPYFEGGPDINDAGHIVWCGDVDGGRNDSRIFHFDGESTRQISQNTLSNQVPRINQSSQIIWTRFNFQDSPWSSHVMLYQDGETIQLSEGAKQIGRAHLSALGAVVWASSAGGVEKWDDGETIQLLPDGVSPQISSNGDVCVSQWDDGDRNFEMLLLRDGRWWQLTESPENDGNGAINTRGEIVWQHGSRRLGIDLLTRSAFVADLDFDGDVDLRDYTVLQECFGHDGPLRLECEQADADLDDDVDHDDFLMWLEYLEGPGV